MICHMKGGSFDILPSRFVSPKSSTIPNMAKSFLCKVHSLTRVLFDAEAHNFTWDANLKKMDGVAFTLGDIRTLYFLAIGFLIATFFAWDQKAG